MKNRYLLYLFFFFISFFNTNLVVANEFEFNVSEIIISDNGNIIETKKGTAESLIDGININADTFLYNKNTSLLTALGDVKVTSIRNNFLIETQSIIYNTEKKEISSKDNTLINDAQGNLVKAQAFLLNLNNDVIKIEKMKMVNLQQDIIKLDTAYINLSTGNLIGKDVSIDLNNKNFNNENEPRLKGASLRSDLQTSTLTKGVFTTCKKMMIVLHGSCRLRRLSMINKKKLFTTIMLG